MFSKPKNSNAPKTAKRKHVTLSIHQKLNIIQRLEKGESRHNIMSEFNISSSTIYDLKKQKPQLENFVSQSATVKSLDKRQTLKKPKLENLDSALWTWFSAKRAEGKPVTGPMIIEKAKIFYDELKLPESEIPNFSKGWLHNFKIRHGIRKLDISGEIKSADSAAANEYKLTFENLVKEHNLSPTQIYNADETGLLWRCLPNSTLAGGDESNAQGFKRNKDRLTVLVCANASGNHKLMPFVIGKFKNPRALKNINHLPVIYDAQPNAWMDCGLFKKWFFHNFVPSVKDNFDKLKLPKDSKAVLILDNCRAHPAASELKSGNIFCTYLPANVTPLIQPMDQGVIQNFKCKYRGMFVQKLLNSDCSVKDFQRQFTVKDAIFTTAIAWSDVKSETLHLAWRNLWPALFKNTLMEEDEDIDDPSVPMEEDILAGESQVINAISSVPTNPLSGLSEVEIHEWIDIDKDEPIEEELSDEAIIQTLLSPKEAQETESDEDVATSTTRITWSDASDALNKFVKFAETSKHYNIAEVMNLHIIRNTFLKKRNQSKQQVDIASMFQRAQKKTTQDTMSVSLSSPTPSTSSGRTSGLDSAPILYSDSD